ncbi:related to Signal recognition particle subunit SRP54 [Saccharomycodes ludwigii]|uniref:Signal recognition particle 54 kDa protein n=1 Tax=Saccharomycodes ludwigii TaxID=36035 RepID=A0A376B881_9ASCO|nr:hypothetical protein SCDLUD_000535 [Saccharomycodes ludwigii]KAH3902936.1 hypothetical protein SCDLUD_000535 [Saccharomycodes ludwigii]SSD60867.1 related to Signal recognition particle subunit SRP54 [Saccharomycodes ludwigii]
MVLADLGKRIHNAVNNALSDTEDDYTTTVDTMLKTITTALLQSDVNIRLVSSLRTNIRNELLSNNKHNLPPSQRKKLIQKVVFDELCNLVDCKEQDVIFQAKKKKANVIMFVGLQGSGKTTSCTKLAVYYAKRGFKVGLVCADTFRAGAFDQLKQNAIKAHIPFYGSYTEPNPVKVASDGVAKFKKEKFEIIIVDTSGRHQQEEALFQEMVEISSVVQPNQTIMVLDASIGQAAEQQAKAFKESANFGAIILTKMDGHAKGGGAISAVAATNTPIIFIGTGEHMHDFEKFSPRSFIQKLLGLGDIEGFVDILNSVTNKKDTQEMMENFKKGKFTLLDFQKQMQTVMKMGPLSNVAQMIPGLNNAAQAMSGGADGGNTDFMDNASKVVKQSIYIMDSMTKKELESDGRCFIEEPSRIVRIARGSGTSVFEVEMLLMQHQMMAKMSQSTAQNIQQQEAMKQMGGANGMSPQLMQQRMQMMQKNPQMMQKMMKQFGGNMPNFPGAGGAGGAGGMPNFGDMMGMMKNPEIQAMAKEFAKNGGGPGGMFPSMGGAGGMPNPFGF